jgi:hypothetical protein
LLPNKNRLEIMSEDFWVPQLQIAEASAWHLCSEMVRHRPEARIYFWHPGGGQYDMLSVFIPTPEGWNNRPLDLNMRGSIRYYVNQRENIIPWKEFFIEGPQKTIEIVERSTGWRQTPETPISTPTVLAYRVISSLVRMSTQTADRVTVDMAFHDSSGFDSGVTNLAPSFEHADRHTQAQPGYGEQFDQYSRLWTLFNQDKVIAYVHDSGHVFLPNGITLDLEKLYDKHRRNINLLVAKELSSLISNSSN